MRFSERLLATTTSLNLLTVLHQLNTRSWSVAADSGKAKEKYGSERKKLQNKKSSFSTDFVSQNSFAPLEGF